MIKFRLRKNLVYLLIYYISWYLRRMVNIAIKFLFNFHPTYILLYLMTLGEIIGGSSIFFYQKKSWKKNMESKYFGLNLIYNKKEIKILDGQFKRIILIFFAACFDFFEFIIGNFFVPKVDSNVSQTIDLRLGCVTTIASSLICSNALSFKIGKHHKVSLIIMGLCAFFSLIIEISYKPNNISFGRFIFARFLVCYSLACISFIDCIEKYLVDTNFLNPFKILMTEGTFEFIMAIFISIEQDPFKEIIKLHEEKSNGQFILFIFLLFLYLLLSTIINAYKIYCNVIYSPMARSLMDYFMGPFFCTYHYIENGDFQNDFIYFFLSEIINIITVFFGCVYNEYIILFCCGIEHDTTDAITERALSKYNKTIIYKLGEIINNEDDNNDTLEFN